MKVRENMHKQPEEDESAQSVSWIINRETIGIRNFDSDQLPFLLSLMALSLSHSLSWLSLPYFECVFMKICSPSNQIHNAPTLSAYGRAFNKC